MIARDVWLAVTRRWRRNLLTAAAIGVSAATVVVLVGFVHSAAARTAATLTGLSSDEITVTLPGSTWATPEDTLLARLSAVPQIESAGTIALPGDSTSAVDVVSTRSRVRVRTSVTVATEAGLSTRGASITVGAYPSAAALRDRDQVLIGQRLATELRIGSVRGAVVEVNGVPLAVAGIVADSVDGAILSAGIVLDPVVADRLGILPATRTVQLKVSPGSAESLAAWLPTALHPAQPGEVSVSVPPSPRTLQEQLAAEASTWVVVITAVLVAVSAFTVMTTMQIAVQERRREIGIRRALGVQAFRIGAQFCSEALVIGLVGGLFGSCLGMIALAGWGAVAEWTILVPPFLAWVPVGGLLIGGASGLIPAHLATRVDPAELLRAT